MRQVINPNQTQHVVSHEYNSCKYNFLKNQGYIFSDDSAMDDAVRYFTTELKFKLIGANNKPQIQASITKVRTEGRKNRESELLRMSTGDLIDVAQKHNLIYKGARSPKREEIISDILISEFEK